MLRAIFRACFRRFREIAASTGRSKNVNLQLSERGTDGRIIYGRKEEEFVADFYLIAKRILTEEESKILRFHFFLGADWRLCCKKLQIEKGPFFHACYRIEQKLGRAFREMEPYGLFPIDEYFNGGLGKAKPQTHEIAVGPGRALASKVPLKKAA